MSAASRPDPSGPTRLVGARLRELASNGSSDDIRAFLGSLLPEAQLNGGGNGPVAPLGASQQPPSG